MTFNLDPKQLMEFLIFFGPYFAIYLICQAFKTAFKLKGRWVLIMVFAVGYVMAAAQLIIQDTTLIGWKLGSTIFINGSMMAAVSWLTRKVSNFVSGYFGKKE